MVAETEELVVPQPDVLELVYWLQQIRDPLQRFIEATKLGDEVRASLQVELAAQRREAACQARDALIAKGVKATEATAEVARLTGSSAQTIGRMVSERKQYGVKGGVDVG